MKPSSVAQAAEQLIAIQQPFFIRGAVGVGKSQIMAQVCAKLGYEFRDVRLSQMDPTDIKGFPCPDKDAGVMKWLPADFLPSPGYADPTFTAKPMKAGTSKTTSLLPPMIYPNGGPKGLLFLDELPSAPQAVQAAAYQLVLDRKVGNYSLPPGWAIAAAGNRDVDRSIVNKMPAALANRLVHIDFEVNLDDWVTHAMNNGIDPQMIAYLRVRENMLHKFDPTENPMAFPTPRTWFVADKIHKANMPWMLEYELLKGTIGDGPAGEYVAFLKTIKDMPTIEEIRLSPDTTKVPESPSTLHALTTTLSMSTDEDRFKRYLIYVKRFPTEFQVVYMRDLVRRGETNKLKHLPEFTKWSLENADVVI